MAVAESTRFQLSPVTLISAARLELRAYSRRGDDDKLRQHEADVEHFLEIAEGVDLDRFPDLLDSATIVERCAEDYDVAMEALRSGMCRSRRTVRKINPKLISEVLDLVDQVSELQLCYDVMAEQCQKICDRLATPWLQ